MYLPDTSIRSASAGIATRELGPTALILRPSISTTPFAIGLPPLPSMIVAPVNARIWPTAGSAQIMLNIVTASRIRILPPALKTCRESLALEHRIVFENRTRHVPRADEAPLEQKCLACDEAL